MTRHAPVGEGENPRRPLIGRAIIAVFGVCVVVGGLMVGTLAWVLSDDSSGCSSRDDRLALALDQLEVLDLRPPDATLRDRYSGCDGEDGFAYAGRRYRAGGDSDTVVAFYRGAAVEAGWTLEKEDPSPVTPGKLVVSGSRLCLTKLIEGTEGHLGVWFPSDFGDNTNDYGVEVTASHDGSAWC